MRSPYLLIAPTVIIACVISILLQINSPNASLPVSGNVTVVTFSQTDHSLSSPISSADRELYEDMFRAQKKADWPAANAAVAKLENKLLLGHVYAERYLHHNYKASAEELLSWIANYSDQFELYDIYTLANAKSSMRLPIISKEASLQGYGDDNGLAASFGDSKHAATWHKALGKWRSGAKSEAAKLFVSMLKDENLSGWKKSAASFWAYRSYLSTGDKVNADKYLQIAAQEPRSFYGILARKQLKQSLELDSAPITLSVDDTLDMLSRPIFKRIIALSEVGRSDLAEKELRALFPAASRDQKFRLLALAHELNLASVQIAMARQLANDERPLDFARYPIPHWQPQNGFKVDPALIYALTRQESGFRASAVSPVGALGLMQLMPQTANFMKKRMASEMLSEAHPEITTNPSDPTFNMALGQQYVRHLLDNDLVDGNLIYMLVAYNAGAGRLADWKESIVYKNDPLLFIESIPFAETRYYVMQVMTNYWIYSELAGNSIASAQALLSGQWPEYDRASVPIAVRTIQDIIDNAS
jgi:soluble lytic murein transglycosylase